jgi:hypothetical protein
MASGQNTRVWECDDLRPKNTWAGVGRPDAGAMPHMADALRCDGVDDAAIGAIGVIGGRGLHRALNLAIS